MAAISTIIFSLSSPPYFFSLVAEMRNPNDYLKAMVCSQSIVFSVYTIIGTLVYYYAGSFVTSPALGSAGLFMKKVCYGLALPGLLVSTAILCHVRGPVFPLKICTALLKVIQVPAKVIFVRIMRGSKHLSASTFKHWITWLSCTGGVCIIGYIIASAVPSFGSIISLVGSLFGTFITLQPFGIMWLYDNPRADNANKKLWLVGAFWSIFFVVLGFFFQVAGTYAAITQIKDLYTSESRSPWSCADNSASVH